MVSNVTIRAFTAHDATAVQALFVKVNRLLAPPGMEDAFERYIARSIVEEIGHIEDYYGGRQGSFWVAVADSDLAGMFGLERTAAADAMELRRMYVEPALRRAGIGRAMLQFAEDECRRQGIGRLELSTSEVQPDALRLYRAAGYRLEREEVADAASNKTIGGGIRRYYFSKQLIG